MTSPTLSEKMKEILKGVELHGNIGLAHQAIMEAIRESVPVTLNGFKNPREEMLRRLQ